MRNHVQLIGNLGANPVIREFEKGYKMAKFSVATTDYIKEKDSYKTQTYWHNAIAWGLAAEKIEKKCVKGTEVFLTGKLVSRSYEDKEGVKRYIVEVHVNEIICQTKTKNEE